MRASIVGTAVVGALAAAVVLPVGAASASTDTVAPKIRSVSAPSIVGISSKGAIFDVVVKASDNIDIARVVVGVIDSAGKLAKPVGFATKLTGGMTWDGTYTARITMPASVAIGTWNVSAFAEDNEGNRSAGVTAVRDSFVLKYATRIAKLNAAPEPAPQGKPMTVSGLLQQATTGGWTPYSGKTVKVQFRKKGQTNWLTIGSAASGTDGRFVYDVASLGAGDWRAVATGNSTRMKAISSVDSVLAK